MRLGALLVLLAAAGAAEVREFPGGKAVPHEKYVRVVSEKDSPVQQTYVKAKDGLYIAAAIRKPKGDGPFPAFVHFHGAPGGQGMETVLKWSRGETGGPMWERYLQEGFVVIVADYRGGPRRPAGPPLEGAVTQVDDAAAIVEHVRGLPFVDSERIVVYGGSMGGGVVLELIGRTKVRAAGVGAPAVYAFLGLERTEPGPDPAVPDSWKALKPDAKVSAANVAAVQCPVLIQVGGIDGVLPSSRLLHHLLEKNGKKARLEIYANSPHGFYFGPLTTPAPRPLLDTTLAALESGIAFMKEHTR